MRRVWPLVCRKYAANPYVIGLKIIEKFDFLAGNTFLGNIPNKDLMALLLFIFNKL